MSTEPAPAFAAAVQPLAARPGSVRRTLAILEAVASRGGATAKEIAYGTDIPLPTVYRLVRELMDSDYLVHIRDGNRFELGYKLHQLAVSLHEQLGVPRGVRAEVTAIHQKLGLAAYFALHRGSEIVVVFAADSASAQRLRSIDFGFHEAPHATALGKIFLADLDPEKRAAYLPPEADPALCRRNRQGTRPMMTAPRRTHPRCFPRRKWAGSPGTTCSSAAGRRSPTAMSSIRGRSPTTAPISPPT